MNQDNIFKLLLTVLLIANNQNGCSGDCSTESSVNNVIILALLLGALSGDPLEATEQTTF